MIRHLIARCSASMLMEKSSKVDERSSNLVGVMIDTTCSRISCFLGLYKTFLVECCHCLELMLRSFCLSFVVSIMTCKFFKHVSVNVVMLLFNWLALGVRMLMCLDLITSHRNSDVRIY
jgi:hypothetical protein